MPVFLLAVLGGLGQIAASLVGRVLIALGIGYVTYKGIDVSMAFLKAQIFSNLVTSYPEINAALSMLNIGKAINVTFSAIAARNVINGLTAGSVTKQVIK